jgi:quinol-cytochrome oxidoreductase complex cytochrome b subunit
VSLALPRPPLERPPPRRWGARLAAPIVAAAALLAVSGALAAIYVRPYAHRPPAHVAFAVATVTASRMIHLVALGVLIAGLVALAVVRRGWRAGVGAGPQAAAVAVAVGCLATGLVTPWGSLLPWSAPLGANMARPMPLLGHEGPFPELVGVNVSYDDALVVIGRLRLGPRGAGRLYLAHVVVLPLAATALALWLVRRRR